jgi:hypothetical protein
MGPEGGVGWVPLHRQALADASAIRKAEADFPEDSWKFRRFAESSGGLMNSPGEFRPCTYGTRRHISRVVTTCSGLQHCKGVNPPIYLLGTPWGGWGCLGGVEGQ